MRELTLADCIIPQWPAPSHVKALVTTRRGGVSTGPYESLNLGFSTADDPRATDENRARLARLAGSEPKWLKQVHAATVVDADTLTDRVDADAAVATRVGTVCAVLVADCLPVLITDRDGTIVAAAHAGWRGLAAGVIDNTVAAITGRCVNHADLLAYIGPGIGANAFEVGRDVFDAFTAEDAAAAAAFRRHTPTKWYADLAALTRRALARCGVRRVYGGDACTYSDAARFYSHRRNNVTGRMAALIWREHAG